ncbi:Carbohydrate sulfotransferase 6, partial [Stegodyphus mimosarum]
MTSDSLRRSSCVPVAGHSYRCRRFLPWVAFFLIIITVQFYAIAVKDFGFLNTLQSLTTNKHRKTVGSGPLHVLLIAYARTGSSFLGDLLQSLPGTFYYFEPLHFLSNPVLNSSFHEARSLLDKIFHCNVSKIQGFLMWQKKHDKYMKLRRSFEYWRTCSKFKTCYNGSYIDAYCRNHTTLIAKTIRLNLKEASKLFDTHPELNLKIIYLARDPRGTLNSRMKFPVAAWCNKDPMCSIPKHFCSALSEDLDTICSLSSNRPDDFAVVRYEDLAMDPFGVANHLVKFLGLPSMPTEMEVFLNTHTSVTGNVKEISQ